MARADDAHASSVGADAGSRVGTGTAGVGVMTSVEKDARVSRVGKHAAARRVRGAAARLPRRAMQLAFGTGFVA